MKTYFLTRFFGGMLAFALVALIENSLLTQKANAGSFTLTGTMSQSRRQQTATLLQDGTVLVAGGFNVINGSLNTLSSAELYDPISGIWTNTGHMGSLRGDHPATLLPNGRVLVTGGFDGASTLSSAELYDPTSRNWTPTAPMHLARRGHTATLLRDGRVLVAGGAILDRRAELYDPSTGTWAFAGTNVANHSYHTATLLPNGKVLVVAGFSYDTTFRDIATAEIYDPSDGVWSATGPLPVANEGNEWHTATLLTNGQVLVAGGIDENSLSYGTNGLTSYFLTAYLYDPNSGQWAETGSMSTERGDATMTAVLLQNGKLLFAGGDGAGHSQFAGPSLTNLSVLASAELYDSSTGTWRRTGAMHTRRFLGTATLLTNGLVLFAGGIDDTFSVSSTAELYDDSASGVPVQSLLTNLATLPGGQFQFNFTNTSGVSFDVFGTTNLSLPFNAWTLLGNAEENVFAQFQFIDTNAASYPQRFYRVSSR